MTHSESNNRRTIAQYESWADGYRDLNVGRPNAHEIAFIERVAAFVPGGRVLELGSGPGVHAREFERLGLTVDRTDATVAFVAMMNADGFDARELDALDRDWKTAVDVVFAWAVFLHFSRPELADVLETAANTAPVLAFATKEGDGDAWVEERHFTYWREAPLRKLLVDRGWEVVWLEHVERTEDWLYVIARRADANHRHE